MASLFPLSISLRGNDHAEKLETGPPPRRPERCCGLWVARDGERADNRIL